MHPPPHHPLTALLEQILRQPPQYDWQLRDSPLPPLDRGLKHVPPPRLARPTGSVGDARSLMRTALEDYLASPDPPEMLLLRGSPGAGKTTLAVEAAGRLACAGRRVAYAGPRHDLFPELVARARHPEQWYEWQPRRAARPQTCRYASQVEAWLQRGYPAMDFCRGVCGPAACGSGLPAACGSGLPTAGESACPYHAQRLRPEPVIYLQHQHVSTGHPLHFDVLFGDESPLQAFTHAWRIPSAWVHPPGLDGAQPLAGLLHLLAFLCCQPRPISGPSLLEALGGPAWVEQACLRFAAAEERCGTDGSSARSLSQTPDPSASPVTIHDSREVERKPYSHLAELLPLLLREARLALAGRPYPHRLIAAAGHLTLLLRRQPAHLPRHIVWLDGTARPEIYRALFHRPVRLVEAAPGLHGRIYQVVDRLNGKRSLSAAGKRRQARDLIHTIVRKHGYRRPSVVGFKDFVAQAGLDPSVFKTAHFYAARGSNSHEQADAMLIVGAPQADLYSLVQLAKMLHFERDRAFDVTWTRSEQVYPYVAPDGCGRSYPVYGFWNDPDLQALLESVREDEILQAAHRGRPVNHACDIWLLTNLPIAGLPPDALLSMRQVLDAPAGVALDRWRLVMDWLEGRACATVADLVALGLSYKTARGYLERIAELPGWELAAVKSQHGKPTRQVRLVDNGESC